MAQLNVISEQELAEKIIHLHDVLGLGFRRLAKELTSQGCRMNKDGANRLYNKYKRCDDVATEEDEELKQLKEAEEEARGHLRLEREKEEARKRLTVLFVEKKTMTFEQRKRFFTNKDKLLKFAQRTMPVTDPMLWDELKEYCFEQGYDLADATAIALGKQKNFEDQPTKDANAKQRLDLYLRNGIRECLNDWRADEQEECRGSKEEESELPINIRERREFVTVELTDDYLLQ
jgi:hypothetical protein